jgi:hypothetical protein
MPKIIFIGMAGKADAAVQRVDESRVRIKSA